MRWLLIKDLQILRRSPLLTGLLVVYPVVIALMIGFALSSPPGKPKVAFYNQVTTGHGTIALGGQKLDVAHYARSLLSSVDAIHVHSRAEAVSAVRQGTALAAVIVPADLPRQLQSLITQGIGSPTVELIINTHDPLERQLVDQAISSRVTEVEQAVSRQLLRTALADLQQVLGGGTITVLGQTVHLLGLRNARAIVLGTIATLPARSPLRPALEQVVAFTDLAIQGLSFASPALGTIGNPLTVQRTELAGRTTPSDVYAAAIAVIVSEMFVAVLLASGLLALERSENAYARLVRGLVSPSRLLAAKIALSGGISAVVTLAMAAFVSAFVALDWSHVPLWIIALGLAGLAFAALGTAIGATAREVSAASLLAFAIALPVAFVALVPSDAVSGALGAVLNVVAFVFPFRAGLQAVTNAFTGAPPAIGLSLLHLVVLTVVYGALARLAVSRFARV